MELISAHSRDRLDICEGNTARSIEACPEYKPKTKRCGSCGCVMPFKAKLPNAKCPKGKW